MKFWVDFVLIHLRANAFGECDRTERIGNQSRKHDILYIKDYQNADVSD
jgi:hypothetical protein